MIRVLYVAPFDRETSADGAYADSLTNALGRTGKVEVVRGVTWAPDRSGLEHNGPSAYAKAIEELARSSKVDLVHIHYEPGLYSPRAAWGLSRRAKRMPPLVVTLHRVAAYNGRLRGSGLKQARAVGQEWLLARCARMFLVHAEHSARILGRRYPRVPCEVQAMPVPSDTCNAARKRGGPILYFGNHHPGKGILEFVMAMQRLPEIKAVVAGKSYPKWAEYNEAVRREASKAPNVAIEDGWTTGERKHELFREACAVALPYSALGSGSLVLQDAIAHERPVLASTAEPLRSLVTELGVGLVAEPGDTATFAEALRRVAEQELSAFAADLARARQTNSEDAIASRLAALYGRVLAQNDGRSS